MLIELNQNKLFYLNMNLQSLAIIKAQSAGSCDPPGGRKASHAKVQEPLITTEEVVISSGGSRNDNKVSFGEGPADLGIITG